MKEITFQRHPEEGTPMWELWKRNDVMLVAAGSLPCIRELYILAKQIHRLGQLYYVASSNEDYALGSIEDKIRAAIRVAGRRPGVRLVILYLSCPDILIRLDFDDLEETLTAELGLPVRCYFRGPLGKEEARYLEIGEFKKTLPAEKGWIEGDVPQLMPPIADMAAVSDWMRWKHHGNIVVTPSGCRSCMADADMDPAQKEVYYTEIQRDDVIFGLDEATAKQADTLMEEKGFRGYSLIGTAVPAMIGMDGDGIVKATAEKGHPGLYFPCDGFRDGMVGVAQAEEIVAKSRLPFLKEEGNRVVQVFGYSPMISGDIHQFDECITWLREKGFTPRFTGLDGLTEKPVVSWVVSASGIPAARFLLEQAGVPMVIATPLGDHSMASWKRNITELAAGKDKERMLKIHNMTLPRTNEEKILFLGEPVQVMAAAHYFRHAGYDNLKLLCYAWSGEDRALYEAAPGGEDWFTMVSTKEDLAPWWETADLVVCDDAFREIMGEKPHISLNMGFFSGRDSIGYGSGVLGSNFRDAADRFIQQHE